MSGWWWLATRRCYRFHVETAGSGTYRRQPTWAKHRRPDCRKMISSAFLPSPLRETRRWFGCRCLPKDATWSSCGPRDQIGSRMAPRLRRTTWRNGPTRSRPGEAPVGTADKRVADRAKCRCTTGENGVRKNGPTINGQTTFNEKRLRTRNFYSPKEVTW